MVATAARVKVTGSGMNRELSKLSIPIAARLSAVATINGLTFWEDGTGMRGDGGGMRGKESVEESMSVCEKVLVFKIFTMSTHTHLYNDSI